MRRAFYFLTMLVMAPLPILANAQNEISLLSRNGEAVAYIAVDDGLTTYLWSGTPTAYLKPDINGGYHVYGFNGKHLGWFMSGVIYDHQGLVACATNEVLETTKIENIKPLRDLKPLKSIEDIPPLRPIFSRSFGKKPCQFLIAEGMQ